MVETACVDNSSDPATVKVQLSDPTPGDVTYQIGLAGPSRGTDQYPDGGGPSLVAVGSTIVTVQLAGPVYDDDHVVVTGDGALSSDNLHIDSSCGNGSLSDLNLKDPFLAATPAANTEVAQQQCNMPSAAGVAVVTLQNNNSVNSQFEQATGLDQIPYTLILVRNDTGEVTGDGALLQFHQPGTDGACIATDSTKAGSYEVRAIGVDGSVVTSPPIALSAAPSRPHPSPSGSSHPASSSHPTTTPSATSPNGNPAPGGSNNPGGVGGPSGSSSSSASATSTAASGSRTPSARPTATPSGTGSGQGTPPSGTPSPSTAYQIAEPRLDSGSRIFVWQPGPATVVLAMALAISALIGGVVWSAKRR